MKKKKILLLTDDIRAHSGVAHMGRELIFNTVQEFDWCCLAGAIKHHEKHLGIIDYSKEATKHSGVEDAYVKLYPVDNYGTPEILRKVIEIEKPDALFLITDPKYFVWIFRMENEIRKKIPIVYLNIWDNLPAPMYNREYYESCDMLLAISKLTKFINEIVLEDSKKSRIIKYLPHGINTKTFFPLEKETQEFLDFKKQITLGKEYDFILLFNSRNMRRKAIPDTILAWKFFIDSISESEGERCLLILHTEPRGEGTDIIETTNYFCSDEKYKIAFSNKILSQTQMNYLYNLSDGVILLSYNEGWGLSLTEALLTATPFVANVTGGMQDQMFFIDDENKWFNPTKDIPSNHKGSWLVNGSWAYPVFPKASLITGSEATPYLYEDICDPKDAACKIKEMYLDKKYGFLKEKGEEGREWALSEEIGFTSKIMGQRFIENMNELFETWKPREKFEFLTLEDYIPRKLKHKIL